MKLIIFHLKLADFIRFIGSHLNFISSAKPTTIYAYCESHIFIISFEIMELLEFSH